MIQGLKQHRAMRSILIFSFALCMLSSHVVFAENDSSHFDLGPWRQYLAQQLDPGLAGVDISNHSVETNADWKTTARLSLLPDFARSLFSEKGRQVSTYTINSASTRLALDGQSSLLGANRFQLGGLQQQFLQPGIVGRLSNDSIFSVGLVLASQQYGSATLDRRQSFTNQYGLPNTFGQISPLNNNQLNNSFAFNQFEVTQGIGFQFGYSYSLFDGVELSAAYQSRIDTEALNSIRGVYANPADLDTPARAGVNLGFNTSPTSQLQVGVENIAYSDINAFTGSFLPGRFLSLLGDSDSPNFAWSDVTVFNARWSWAMSSNWNLQVEYSTRTQPLPDVGLLADALRSELADSSFGLFVDHRTTRNSMLRLGMSYAPAEYAFGGNVLGVITDDLNQNVEVDLSWQLVY